MTDNNDDRPNPPIKRRRIFPGVWGLIIGFVVVAVTPLVVNWRDSHRGPHHSVPAASRAEFQTVVDAINQYEQTHGERPATMDQIGVTAPGVVYMPAVRPSDPTDMVVLCTLTRTGRGRPYLVLYNDGRVVEEADVKLPLALTLDYIGEQIEIGRDGAPLAPPWAATQPATP
jgi:hypothetical protein